MSSWRRRFGWTRYTSVCCVCGCVRSVVSDSLRPHGLQPSRLSVHGILQVRILEWAAVSSSGIFPTQGLNLHLLPLLRWQADSLPLVPPVKCCGNGCLAPLHSHLINTRQISQELLHMRHVDWLQTISLSCLDIPAKINPESQKNGSSQNSLKTLEAGLHAHGFPVPHRHLLDGAAKRTPSKPRPRSSCSQKTLKLTRGISTCWLLCGAVQL